MEEILIGQVPEFQRAFSRSYHGLVYHEALGNRFIAKEN
jgi:hypothetical protein